MKWTPLCDEAAASSWLMLHSRTALGAAPARAGSLTSGAASASDKSHPSRRWSGFGAQDCWPPPQLEAPIIHSGTPRAGLLRAALNASEEVVKGRPKLGSKMIARAGLWNNCQSSAFDFALSPRLTRRPTSRRQVTEGALIRAAHTQAEAGAHRGAAL